MVKLSVRGLQENLDLEIGDADFKKHHDDRLLFGSRHLPDPLSLKNWASDLTHHRYLYLLEREVWVDISEVEKVPRGRWS